jgi:hypothetical protein
VYVFGPYEVNAPCFVSSETKAGLAGLKRFPQPAGHASKTSKVCTQQQKATVELSEYKMGESLNTCALVGSTCGQKVPETWYLGWRSPGFKTDAKLLAWLTLYDYVKQR